MLTESFVAVMAMIAACVLTPGIYFAINSPAAVIGTDVTAAATTISEWGYTITPDMLTEISNHIEEESILSRTGGAPTFAIGMATIFSQVIGGKALMAFWYHFAILFEALFILTTIDAGTRVCRFMIQEVIGTVYKPFANTEAWLPNITATALSVAAWGYFLYQGVVDPLGGINTLWPLFGISNQMLAGIALIFGTTVLFKMGKKKYTWVTLIPTVLLLVVTLTAGWQKIFHSNPAIGFLSHANKFQEAYNNGEVLAPAKDLGEMRQILFNDYIDAALCAIFMLVVIMVFISAIRIWIKILKNQRLELHESSYIPRENINAGA